MVLGMKDKIDKELKQIANHLMINSSFLSNLGLFHGKMGIILFFAHYARYTKNSLYDDFAGELLDEVFEDIHAGLSLDLENGLAGIGWGLLHLLKNQFVTGDPDEILMDIDSKFLEVNLLRVRDLSLERGLEGYLCYLQERLSVTRPPLFDSGYINDFQKVISKNPLHCAFTLSYLVEKNKIEAIDNLPSKELGIYEGYVGYGFQLIQQKLLQESGCAIMRLVSEKVPHNY